MSRFQRTLGMGRALAMMAVSVAVLLRGGWYVASHHLGLSALIQPLVVGGMIFILGWARWRFWRAPHP